MNNAMILAQHTDCTIQLVRRMRHLLNSVLMKSGESKSTIESAMLAMSEHLGNLAEHTMNTQCSVRWDASSRTIEIEDNGPDASAYWKTSESLADLQTDEPRTSGMGLAIIKSMFPEVQYDAGDGQRWNRLLLPFPEAKSTIVVIDDDPSFLALLEAYLGVQYSVLLFDAPEMALKPNVLDDAQLIICDVHMPGMTGPSLRDKLLGNDKTALIPFVFLTGDTSDHRRNEASFMQIDDYLTKPIDKTTLLDTVQRLLFRSNRLKAQYVSQVDQSINRSLWPEGPWESSNIKVTYDYAVAERGGGDFLYSKALPDRMRFVLGDVMGHGEQAKFYAFALSGFITGLCESLEPILDTGEFLTRLSDLIASSPVLEKTLVTLQVIDVLDQQRLAVATAGHPAPVLIKDDGRALEVETMGSLPGLSAGAYEATELMLSGSDCLLCYSDGLVESLLLAEDSQALLTQLSAMGATQSLIRDAKSLGQHFELHNRQLDDDVTLVCFQSSRRL